MELLRGGRWWLVLVGLPRSTALNHLTMLFARTVGSARLHRLATGCKETIVVGLAWTLIWRMHKSPRCLILQYKIAKLYSIIARALAGGAAAIL